ncbi:imm11 family protein [Thalassococcus sp. S3]|uniref:imm11 family protein n=1 Tax=Thalassococcus sp. S3 TaxID=2017482 RepID=UPI0010243547|nr:DUF1629 domain-containing protein [Thalassococcus sp. S3]QBF32697.1 hypothetical protein CFI11_15960 [Thalassococcus sp. S3]
MMAEDPNFFLLRYDTDGQTGAPYSLDGFLSTECGKTKENTDQWMYKSPNQRGAVDYADRIYFHLRRKQKLPDFYPGAEGFLVSPALHQIFQDCAPDHFRSTPVTVKHKQATETVGELCLVEFTTELPCLDIDTLKARPPEPSRAGGTRFQDNGQVKSCDHLVLQSDLPRLFHANDLPYVPRPLFVAAEVKDLLEQADLVGLYFVPVDELMVLDLRYDPYLGFMRSPSYIQDLELRADWPEITPGMTIYDPMTRENTIWKG